MALLQELIKQIDDLTLNQRIMTEVGKLTKQKKFGLVFAEGAFAGVDTTI